MTDKVIVLTGPTATGKTRLGAELAALIGGEVIGADSMQIYKDLDIGTAKPQTSEMCGVPHHMIGVVSPFENYSVSRYVEDASRCADDILRRGRIPVIVGGTAFYIDSLLAGRDFAEEGVSCGLRDEIAGEYDRLGGEKMLEQLAAFDPESAGRLHANDKKRIVRAFEVYRGTGKTISRHNEESRDIPPRYRAVKAALTFSDRANLYDRINRRVDRMMENGLLQEVEKLLASGLTPEHTAMQAIGYKELAEALLTGGDPEKAAEKIRQNSRRYAKRQLSWLNRDAELTWIRWGKEPDFQEGRQILTKLLEKNGIL